MHRSSSSSYKNYNVKPTPREYTPSYQANSNNNSPVIHKVKQPGFLSNVMQGFAWGTGTSIARNIFESKPLQPLQPLQYTSPNINTPNNQTNYCKTYELCKQMDDPYQCFSKMDQKEYILCTV